MKKIKATFILIVTAVCLLACASPPFPGFPVREKEKSADYEENVMLSLAVYEEAVRPYITEYTTGDGEEKTAYREDYAGEEERACAALMDAVLLRLAEEKRLDVLAALLSGDQKTFEALRCEAPELLHIPAATFEWYETHYLDRDYPIRLIMRLNGVQFPE